MMSAAALTIVAAIQAIILVALTGLPILPLAFYVERRGGFAAFFRARPKLTLTVLMTSIALGIAAFPAAWFGGVVNASLIIIFLWIVIEGAAVISARYLVQALAQPFGSLRGGIAGHLTVLAIMAVLFTTLIWWNNVEVATSTKDSWSFAVFFLCLPYAGGYLVVLLSDLYLLTRLPKGPPRMVATP
jgi:hypothetical protein